jgi:hypothetical protein
MLSRRELTRDLALTLGLGSVLSGMGVPTQVSATQRTIGDDVNVSDGTNKSRLIDVVNERISLVNIFTVPCNPCIEEIPVLNEIYRTGFPVLGLFSAPEDYSNYLTALRETLQQRDLKIEFPNYFLFGEDHEKLWGYTSETGSIGVPHNLIVESRDIISWSHVGKISRNSLIGKVNQYKL